MYKRILVPIDGSEHSLKALEVAKELGEQFKSEIYILSVIQEVTRIDPVPASYAVIDVIPEGAVDITKQILEKAEMNIRPYDYKIQIEYKIGKPAEEILKYANDKDVGLIVIGNRGLGAFSRTFLGSVSNKVINNTKRPVLLIK